jgi:carboxyl-terminal processing protease
MKQSVKILAITLGLMLLTTIAFSSGLIVGHSTRFGAVPVVRAQDQPAEFDVFWEVWNLAENYFIDQEIMENRQRLAYGAINGFIEALGDEGHTRFLTPEQNTAERTSIRGSFFGIGARVGIQDGMPMIVAPFDGSPAQAAGVKAGDIIIEVDGQDVTGMSLNETVEMIRGEKGTEVVLTIFRPDDSESLEVVIIRDEIKIPAASWGIVPGTDVALLRFSQFNGNLNDNVQDVVSQARDAGATALIVDLRNNPGGLLDQAIKVSSQFLSDGNVLLQEDAQGNREEFAVIEGGVAQDIPLIVLVNRGSASSSEIFAGAMQDHERAQVVGETTFGTGTVLKVYDLSDGSSLLLGTSQWLTPDGRLIRKQGITPDTDVELPAGTPLVVPVMLDDMTVADLLDSEDAQLLKALELLDQLPQLTAAEKYRNDLDVIK